MAASYPTASKSFSTKATNDVIEASFINDLQDEITALESALLTGGVAHNVIPSTSGTRTLGTAALPWAAAHLGGNTVTVSTPILSGVQTWNDAAVTFTARKLNVTDTLSAAASLLEDLQVGGVSKYSVSKAGNVVAAGTLAVTGASTLTGAATLSSTLAVTGASTLTGALTGAAATLSGLLTVNGFGTHAFSAGGTGDNRIDIANTTSGVANRSGFRAQAGTLTTQLIAYSQGYTTSGIGIAASALLYTDGAGGLSLAADHASGAIRFYSGGTAERARFDTDGTFRYRLTSALVAGNSGAQLAIAGNSARLSLGGSGTGANDYVYFYNANGVVGSIGASGTTTTYNTTSDQRLKTDRGLASDLSGLRATKIHDFLWNSDGSIGRGVFAQEAYGVFPLAVSVGTDERPWAVDYSKYVPDLIVGWQQHDARIAALEAKLEKH